jgi:hypothetical protein
MIRCSIISILLSAGAYYSPSSSGVGAFRIWRSRWDLCKKWIVEMWFPIPPGVSNLSLCKTNLWKRRDILIGLNAEQTTLHFDLYHLKEEVTNDYWHSSLANFNNNGKMCWIYFSYRRTISRPGMGELNQKYRLFDPIITYPVIYIKTFYRA